LGIIEGLSLWRGEKEGSKGRGVFIGKELTVEASMLPRKDNGFILLLYL